MSTELAIPTSEPPSIDLFRQYQEQAAALLKTGFLPKHITTAEQAVAVVLIGRELGIPMMLALRKVYVIQGTPCLAAELMLALAERTGQLDDCRIEHEGETCRVTIKRKGRKSPHTTEFSQADARKLGLADKDNWKKQEKVMRQWRAVSANLRVTFPDATGGLYSLEELAPEIAVDERGNPTVEVTNGGTPSMMPKRKGELPAQPTSVADTLRGGRTGEAVGDSRVEDARQPLGSSIPAGGSNPVGATTEVLLQAAAAIIPDPWQELRGLMEGDSIPAAPIPAAPTPYVAATDAEVQSGFAEPTVTQALAPGALTFELNGKPVVTAGITKETILKAFKLGALADELAGKGTAKNLLGSHFGVEHRQELSEPAGKAYVAELTKIVNRHQRDKRDGK